MFKFFFAIYFLCLFSTNLTAEIFSPELTASTCREELCKQYCLVGNQYANPVSCNTYALFLKTKIKKADKEKTFVLLKEEKATLYTGCNTKLKGYSSGLDFSKFIKLNCHLLSQI